MIRNSTIPQVAIVGAGPAGCTLACLLAKRGISCVVFDDDKRPDLLVGESLLPTVVQILRELDIEAEVKAMAQFKPGVSFLHESGEHIDFFFPPKERKNLPNYAYNVPRPAFDNIIRKRAESLGVRFVSRRAGLTKGTGDREIELDAASLESIGGEHPKLLVDATGRARVFARVLGLGARRGQRADIAYFAHYENFDSDGPKEGQVVLTVLRTGWSWRIPLPGRLSVGIVVPSEIARGFGALAEERMEAIISSEPLLNQAGRERKRITEVMTYTNYQLVSERGFGSGWASVGDAYGFVDPMLSPGLFMAMRSAKMLDAAMVKAGKLSSESLGKRLATVYKELEGWHTAWQEIIDYIYDGSLFSLNEGGKVMRENVEKYPLMSKVERHLTRCITGMVSGAETTHVYNRKLLRFFRKYLMREVRPPEDYAIPSALKDSAINFQN